MRCSIFSWTKSSIIINSRPFRNGKKSERNKTGHDETSIPIFELFSAQFLLLGLSRPVLSQILVFLSLIFFPSRIFFTSLKKTGFVCIFSDFARPVLCPIQSQKCFSRNSLIDRVLKLSGEFDLFFYNLAQEITTRWMMNKKMD